MKEQFVTYEIALALKELGFDEPCLTTFDEDGRLQSIYNIDESSTYDEEFMDDTPDKLYCSKRSVYSDYAIAPLWQQVEDWLREKHSLFIEIELTDNTCEKHYQYCVVDSKNREYHDEDMIDQATRRYNFKDKYEAYSKAREAAVLMAIELLRGNKGE